MQPERWREIREMILEKFDILEEGVNTHDDPPERVEYVVFEGPQGQMKVEFVTQPKKTGRRVFASARIGSLAHEQILYSSDEFTHYVSVFTWDDDMDDWKEIRGEMFT